MAKQQLDVLIIGAGMAGVSAALKLQEQGLSVQILEKSKGIGGRMATRRLDSMGIEGKADHGAQFFTTRSPEFSAFVKEAETQGWVKPWFSSGPEARPSGERRPEPGSEGAAAGAAPGTTPAGAQEVHTRYLAVDGMSALIKHMVAELKPTNPVHLHQKANRLTSVSGKHWRVTCDSGMVYEASRIILTSPVPQSLELLQKSAITLPTTPAGELEKITYECCIAVMLVLDGHSKLPEEGYLRPDSKKVTWIADSQKKGISPALTVLTVHTLPKWSQRHWTSPDHDTVQQVWTDIQDKVGGGQVNLVSSQVHRWQYSQPRETFPERCLALQPGEGGWTHPTLIFAGDAFGGPRVEGAYLSGQAAGLAAGTANGSTADSVAT
ncbi:MAG: FAD-dependent oxidoreductase [Methylotenera sp.]|nr:FAD-dependent oxidoreductase [Oligoflexia bacterium]